MHVNEPRFSRGSAAGDPPFLFGSSVETDPPYVAKQVAVQVGQPIPFTICLGSEQRSGDLALVKLARTVGTGNTAVMHGDRYAAPVGADPSSVCIPPRCQIRQLLRREEACGSCLYVQYC